MSAADFGHVPGIDVNPADGRVYVATIAACFSYRSDNRLFWCLIGSRTLWVSPWSGQTTSSPVDTPVMTHRRPWV
jgi:hypothetical protein